MRITVFSFGKLHHAAMRMFDLMERNGMTPQWEDDRGISIPEEEIPKLLARPDLFGHHC